MGKGRLKISQTQIESQDVINRLNRTAWELNESLLELIVTGVLGQGR